MNERWKLYVENYSSDRFITKVLYKHYVENYSSYRIRKKVLTTYGSWPWPLKPKMNSYLPRTILHLCMKAVCWKVNVLSYRNQSVDEALSARDLDLWIFWHQNLQVSSSHHPVDVLTNRRKDRQSYYSSSHIVQITNFFVEFLYEYCLTDEHCWKKNSGAQWTRTSNF